MTGFENGVPRIYMWGGYAPTIHSHVAKEPFKIMEIEKMEELKVKVRQATKKGYVEVELPGAVDMCYPSSTTRRRVQDGGHICPTLATENIPNVIELGDKDFANFTYEIDGEIYLIRIRKLTPKECWRLMDFSVCKEDGTWNDEVFERAEKVNSATQLYKQAGNSIVDNCLVALIGQLITGKEDVYKNI